MAKRDRRIHTTSRLRASFVRLLVPVYLVAIFGSATAITAAPLAMAATPLQRVVGLAAAPLLFTTVLLLAAGLLSYLTRTAIVEGRFPRSLGHSLYGPRRLYALCWTSIFYCLPVYHAMLAIPFLRHLTLRLFGYRGSLDFTIYPDTWIRDLPLLEIGAGAYISNKATVSPNMCLKDGTNLIRRVEIGARSLIGHLTMIAPGVRIGPDVEIGVGTGVGLRVQVGAGSFVGRYVALDHGVRLGRNCRVGVRAYIGHGSIVANDLEIPSGAVIPPRSILRVQADVEAALSRVLTAEGRPDLDDGVIDLDGKAAENPAAPNRWLRRPKRSILPMRT